MPPFYGRWNGDAERKYTTYPKWHGQYPTEVGLQTSSVYKAQGHPMTRVYLPTLRHLHSLDYLLAFAYITVFPLPEIHFPHSILVTQYVPPYETWFKVHLLGRALPKCPQRQSLLPLKPHAILYPHFLILSHFLPSTTANYINVNLFSEAENSYFAFQTSLYL